MMAVYNRYRVYSTEVTLRMVNSYTTGTFPAVVAMYASNVNTPVSTVNLAEE